MDGQRERSYFGIYSVERDEVGDKVLMHGTTVHGLQHGDPRRLLDPTTYYGPRSGIGLVLTQAPALFGTEARIGIVGVGVGTLACYRRPGQAWMLFEIDPTVLHFSENGAFTFMRECAAGVPVVFGDARLTLERAPPATFDLLAIDAFSSDAIPQHLLTREAVQIYLNALSEDGVLMVHISNRYVALRPVLARLVEAEELVAVLRDDRPDLAETSLYPSTWVAITRDPARLAHLTRGGGWETLGEPEGAVWTDEYASILPHLIWSRFL